MKRLDSQVSGRVHTQYYNYCFYNCLQKIIGIMEVVIICSFYDVFVFEYTGIVIEWDNVSGNTPKPVK